jgi:hypothetical protein
MGTFMQRWLYLRLSDFQFMHQLSLRWKYRAIGSPQALDDLPR